MPLVFGPEFASVVHVEDAVLEDIDGVEDVFDVDGVVHGVLVGGPFAVEVVVECSPECVVCVECGVAGGVWCV